MKLKIVILCVLCFMVLESIHAQQKANSLEVAKRVLRKGLTETDLGTYQGSLLLQGMSELALVSSDDKLMNETVSILRKFGTNELKGRGSFISYRAGGNGAAYLKYRKATNDLDVQVTEAAREMVKEQNRSKEGILVPPWISDSLQQVFIDMAFAVTPYLLYSGLSENRNDYVDLAVFETLELFRILSDKQTGLLHQGRGFQGLNVVSEDNWSRGNGWGALAMASLIRDLPRSHPERKKVERIAKDFFTAAIQHQNNVGLWHQEMTDTTSYVETSGSGLLLYGLGIAIEEGLVHKKFRKNFEKGIASLNAYVAADGSVSYACYSNLCPGKGKKEDYKNQIWVYNDPHAFGPLVLAFAQAVKMGITEVLLKAAPGAYADIEKLTPPTRTYVKFVPERSEDLAWENDRIAFRMYGPSVRDKVGSGIDVWAKSVEYSILDKWYRLNAKGQDYHVDRGEGCDFYSVGYLRGCGGSAIWKDDKPFASQTFSSHRIVKQEKNKIEFEASFDPWSADGIMVSEKKTIRMVKGTNFFQVTSTIYSESTDDLIVAVGLSTVNDPDLVQVSEKGLLSCWENVHPKHGGLGTAVVVDPVQVEGFSRSGKDQFILIRVKPNVAFTYYVGAGWSGNKLFKEEKAWEKYVLQESEWTSLSKVYRDF